MMWSPHHQAWVEVPLAAFAPAPAPAPPPAPEVALIVENSRTLMKDELSDLRTDLEPSVRHQWAEDVRARVAISLPGFTAVLELAARDFATLRGRDAGEVRRINEYAGNFDLLACDANGARVLHSLVNLKAEYAQSFMRNLRANFPLKYASGRLLLEAIESPDESNPDESNLSLGDDLLETWKSTNYLEESLCTSTVAVETRLLKGLKVYQGIPTVLRELSLEQEGMYVFVEMLKKLPASVKGDSGLPLWKHYRGQLIRAVKNGFDLIGEEDGAQWETVEEFIQDLAIELKEKGFIKPKTPSISAFQAKLPGAPGGGGDDEKKNPRKKTCLVCGKSDCKGIQYVRLCPSPGCTKCGSRFCGGARGKACFVHDTDEPPTESNTTNGRGKALTNERGLKELADLFAARKAGKQGKLVDGQVQVTEAPGPARGRVVGFLDLTIADLARPC
jgi:hypothetical protein